MRGRLAAAVAAATVAVSHPTAAAALHATAPDDPAFLLGRAGAVSLSLQPSAGMFGGTATELAFGYPLGAKYQRSELTWDIDRVVFGGVEGGVSLGGRVRLSAGYWLALSEGSGTMVDRDWRYADAWTASIEPDGGNWTDESRHPDTSVDDGMVVDANLSARLLASGPFSLRGIVGVSWQRWAWSARGGTFVYSVDGLRDTVGDFEDYYGDDALVIEYEQQFTIPYGGLGVAWQGAALRLDAHLLLSGAVSASDWDHHVLRGVFFEGDFSGGRYVAFGVAGTWLFSPRWFATAGVDYQSISEITGDVVMSGAEGSGRYPGGGGIGSKVAAGSLGIGLVF